MSRLFDDSSQQYLKYGNAIPPGTPLTMACWYYTDDAAVHQCLMSIARDTGNVDYFELWLRKSGAASDPQEVCAQTRDSSSSAYSASGTTFSTGTWEHAAGVYASDSSRTVYLNGVGGAEETTSIAPSGLGATGIGALVRQSKTHYMSGRIAEAAVWLAALTAGEITQLAAGYSPLFVRPLSLAAYWRLIRDDEDIIGGYGLTAYGGPGIAVQPRVIYPAAPAVMSLQTGITMTALVRRAIEKY